MPDHSKRVKHKLNEYARLAYQRELTAELAKLDAEFGHWRAGRLSSQELNQRIHLYHDGSARKLYKTYEYGLLDLVVANAIVNGPLRRDEVDAQILEVLAPAIRMCEYGRDHAARYDPSG